jgi:hypothetical protein
LRFRQPAGRRCVRFHADGVESVGAFIDQLLDDLRW